MSYQPSVAIVLLNYNGLELLEKNIPFLLSATYSNKQVVIIDNASTDKSVCLIKEKYPSIFLIELSENNGYAAGYNKGLKLVSADFYILLNTDVQVTPGFIEPLINTFHQNPGAGACQPKILSLEQRDRFEYAGAAGGFIDRYGYTFARGRILNYSETDTGQYEKDSEIFWAGGACFAIKASLFWQLKGFYDYYFMYSEEVDLCWRIQLADKQVFYCRSSIVYHRETVKFANQSASRVYLVFRNNLIMLLRNLTWRDKLVIIPVRVVLNIVAAFYFLFKGYFKKSLLIVQSLFAAFKWALFVKKEKNNCKKPFTHLKMVYKKSILLDCYLRKKKTFSSLRQDKFKT